MNKHELYNRVPPDPSSSLSLRAERVVEEARRLDELLSRCSIYGPADAVRHSAKVLRAMLDELLTGQEGAAPSPRAEGSRQIEHAYRVADAWRQGAMDAGNVQPMDPARRDSATVPAPYVAAYEMGYGFIHRSPVAMEMTRRINTIAARCSEAERKLAGAPPEGTEPAAGNALFRGGTLVQVTEGPSDVTVTDSRGRVMCPVRVEEVEGTEPAREGAAQEPPPQTAEELGRRLHDAVWGKGD